MSKIKIGAQVTAKVRHTKVTVSGTFQGYRLEDQEDPTSICGTVLHVKDGMQHLDYVYVDSIKVCESEDERIRTRLVALVEAFGQGKYKDEMLAYLEKKKEQKPESCDCSRDEESYTNGIHHVLMNPEAYGLIKQKPAEQLGGTFTSYDMAKTFTEGQNYVIAHPEKFGLCKPAEWKEEDEGMLNCIIATLCEESHGGRESNDKMVTWLENRLKSLRPQPHWKPSEEQMSALEYFIRSWGESGTMSPQNPTLCAAKTLLNDLKSL